MTPSSDAFEDESDWIQVADESFDSSICCLESISVSRKLDDASFRATSNGSIVFDALSQPVRRVGTQDSSEESEDQNRSQQSIEERFQVLEKLGEGSYGVVFKAKDRRTNEIFAIKKLRIDTEPLRRRHFVNEMLALRVLQEDGSNQNIVKFIDAYSCQREQAVGIIFEYMDGGSLGNILAKNGAIDDEIVLAYICSECLSGLKYIHSMNMIHRDIKPENLLINSKSRIKLSDFGLAKIINRKMKKRASTFVGTLNYMAPERAKGEEYDFSSDIYSLGLTILSIALDKPKVHINPGYWDTLSEHIECNFLNRLVEKDGGWIVEFRDFVSQCLQSDSRRRADANSMLQHDFVQKFSEEGKGRIGPYIDATKVKTI